MHCVRTKTRDQADPIIHRDQRLFIQRLRVPPQILSELSPETHWHRPLRSVLILRKLNPFNEDFDLLCLTHLHGKSAHSSNQVRFFCFVLFPNCLSFVAAKRPSSGLKRVPHRGSQEVIYPYPILNFDWCLSQRSRTTPVRRTRHIDSMQGIDSLSPSAATSITAKKILDTLNEFSSPLVDEVRRRAVPRKSTGVKDKLQGRLARRLEVSLSLSFSLLFSKYVLI